MTSLFSLSFTVTAATIVRRQSEQTRVLVSTFAWGHSALQMAQTPFLYWCAVQTKPHAVQALSFIVCSWATTRMELFVSSRSFIRAATSS